MLFSVIVPTFNRADLLEQAVRSIFVQRCKDFELIVVDDGSVDQTARYLCSLEGKARVFQQANQGPGVARNLGAAHAAGEYLAFLDSDDLWFPWTLEVYRDAISNYHKPSFLAGKPHIFSSDVELQAAQAGMTTAVQFPDYLASGDRWRWWGASSFVIRRDAFLEVSGFVNEFINGEDADLALRMGVAPGFVQILNPVTFAYRQHGISAMKDIKKSIAGAQSLIRAEREERYPGEPRRSAERRQILTRHARPVAIECLRHGLWREAWQLYGSMLTWNLSLRRFKFLAGFPFLAIAEMARGAKSDETL